MKETIKKKYVSPITVTVALKHCVQLMSNTTTALPYDKNNEETARDEDVGW